MERRSVRLLCSWKNPHPEKEIAAITYQPVENDYCGLILAERRGCNPK